MATETQTGEATWDDLYDLNAPPEPAPEPEPESEDIVPTAGSDAELEINANLPHDLDEDEEGGGTKPPAEEPEKEPETPEGENEEPEEEPETDNVDMSGIELYLSQFDIEGGMINFDDGTSKHFSELDAEKQAEILAELHDATSTEVEDKYGLDDNEIGLINYLRTNNLTVEEAIEQMAEERLNVLIALQDIQAVDYEQVPDDSIYLQFLKRSNPEATVDQLEADLQKAKEQNTYDSVVKNLRNQFATEQQAMLQQRMMADQQQQAVEIEDQRAEVVETVSGINDIAGIELNDAVKNGILDRVLEVNEYGDSRFMEEVFGDPETLFNAAFWYYYGEDLLAQRDEYWKREKSAAYKRGREDALGKSPATKMSFMGNKGKEGGGSPSSPQDDDDWLSLHQ